MKELKKDIKNKTIKQLYFFVGEEAYLSDYYINILKKELVSMEEFNFFKFDNENFEGLTDAVESSPMMAEKKLVVVKGTDFSAEVKEDMYREIESALEDVPFYTHIIFCCKDVKKTSKIYKLLSEKCQVVSFEKQPLNDIIKWIINVFKSKGIEIDKENAELITRYAGLDMTTLMNEIEKLSAYEMQNKKVTKEGIEALVTKNIESKIFNLLDMVLDKKRENALLIFNELKKDKEEPVYINGAISKNLMGILEFKYLKNEGKSVSEIGMKMGLKPFVQTKYLRYAEKMSEKFLEKMLSECSKFDIAFKSGEIDGYTGLNVLICEMMK